MDIVFPFRKNYRITSNYQAHLNRRATSPGTDYATPNYADVLAIEDGYVTTLRTDKYGGKYVYLTSKDGKRVWMYLHLHSSLRSGFVKAGQHIAEANNSGLSSGAHTHISLWVNNKNINPEPYLQKLNNITNTKMNYRLYKKNNNLYVDITKGGFVGKIKVERISGKQAGTYIKNININRPNGGKLDSLGKENPVVSNMDKIKYKVIFPGNHKIFDNTVNKPNVSNDEIEKLRNKISELQSKLTKTVNKHDEIIEEEVKNKTRNLEQKLLDKITTIRQKDAEIKDLEQEYESIKVKLSELKNQGYYIHNKKVATLIENFVKESFKEDTKLIRPIKNLINKWNKLINRFAEYIPTKFRNSFKSLGKYDLFIIIAIFGVVVTGQPLIDLLLNLNISQDQAVKLSSFLSVATVGFKQIVTIWYDTNNDGQLTIDDTLVLKDYLDEDVDSSN